MTLHSILKRDSESVKFEQFLKSREKEDLGAFVLLKAIRKFKHGKYKNEDAMLKAVMVPLM